MFLVFQKLSDPVNTALGELRLSEFAIRFDYTKSVSLRPRYFSEKLDLTQIMQRLCETGLWGSDISWTNLSMLRFN